MNGLALDIAHMLAGTMVLVSFLLLYQDRMFALLMSLRSRPSCYRPRSPGKPISRMRRIFMFRP